MQLIKNPTILKKLAKIIDKHGYDLSDFIQINVEPDDLISDLNTARENLKDGEKLFIFDYEGEKWLIPASSEEGALQFVKNLVKKIS